VSTAVDLHTFCLAFEQNGKFRVSSQPHHSPHLVPATMLYLTVLLTLTVLVYPLQIPGTKINWRRGQLQASVYAVEVTFSVECTEELTNRTKADSAVLQELLELADMGGECAVIAAAALDSKSEVRDFIEEMLVACVRRDLNNLVSDACTKIVRGRADFANAVVLSAKAIADARRSNDANAYITNAARIVSTYSLAS
jgi:hypothetical protein